MCGKLAWLLCMSFSNKIYGGLDRLVNNQHIAIEIQKLIKPDLLNGSAGIGRYPPLAVFQTPIRLLLRYLPLRREDYRKNREGGKQEDCQESEWGREEFVGPSKNIMPLVRLLHRANSVLFSRFFGCLFSSGFFCWGFSPIHNKNWGLCSLNEIDDLSVTFCFLALSASGKCSHGRSWSKAELHMCIKGFLRIQWPLASRDFSQVHCDYVQRSYKW